MVENMHKNSKRSLLLKLGAALLSLVFGVFLILWPEESGRYALYVIGGIIALAGLWQILQFLISRDKDLLFQVIIGGICICISVFLIAWPSVLAPYSSYFFSGVAILGGVLGFIRSFALKKIGGKDWAVYLGLSLAAIALGLVFVLKPDLLSDYLNYVKGGTLAYVGISSCINQLRVRRSSAPEAEAAETKIHHAE